MLAGQDLYGRLGDTRLVHLRALAEELGYCWRFPLPTEKVRPAYCQIVNLSLTPWRVMTTLILALGVAGLGRIADS